MNPSSLRIPGIGVCLALMPLASACDRTDPWAEAYAGIVAEEDARGGEGFETVLQALESDDPRIRSVAVRALGRQEDPGHLDRIGRALQDPDARVRGAAWYAAGQALYGTPGLGDLEALVDGARSEEDPAVLGAMATVIGWAGMPSGQAEAASAARAMSILAQVSDKLADTEDPDLLGRLGLARGLEALLRLRDPAAPSLETGRRLAGLLRTTRVEGHERTSARIRTLAFSALAVSGALDEDVLKAATSDPDPEVRRVAYGAILQAGTAYRSLVPGGLSDPSPRVRVAALAAWNRWLRPAEGCGAAFELAGDINPHVALAAIDLLSRPCPDIQAQRAFLSNLATIDSAAWHAPAHALVALAGLAPEQARDRLPGFRQHPSPFARAWAARAAEEAADVTTLEALAVDSDANVRTAALSGLQRTGARRDALFLDALGSTDPQLVMTASSVLSGNDPEDVSRTLEALARFTARGLETERDVRVALLEVLEGSPHVTSDQLRPYLADFDPEIARRAAALMGQEGSEASPSPRPGPAPATPDARRLTALGQSRVVLEMGVAGGPSARGLVSVALRPDLAATNADRFARLVEDGALDGLTFHRVVPNFVIQGGSPGANEYAGHGAYSRDEISAEGHWRGMVGVSTRGRDTGDAQIFVNLIDNTRLDFNYTILGEVVEGMEVVDALPEGAVIRRALLQRRRNP